MSVYKQTQSFWTKSHKYDSLRNTDEIKGMVFITSTSLYSTPSSIQINWKLWEITGTKSFAFLHSCDLESMSRWTRLVSKCKVQLHLSSYHVCSKLIHKHPNVWLDNVKVLFFMQSVKQHLFHLFHQILLKSSIRKSNFSCFNTISNFILISWKMQENEAKKFCFLLTLWPQESSRLVKVVKHTKNQWCL